MSQQALAVKDLPVDVNAKLGETAKKNLNEMIDKEFNNRVQIDYRAKNKKKSDIIAQHKKRLNITEKIDLLSKKVKECEELKKTINRLGFNTHDGSYYSGQNPEIEEELDSLDKSGSEIMTVKHKLQTRLMLATTVGEATVIMKEILGNTLIPCVAANAISFDKQS